MIDAEPNTADVVVSLVLLFGASFVLGVAHLSRLNANNILRIATLERAVFHDELTGLFDRRFLVTRLPDEVARATRYTLDLSIIVLDIDHFKRVNDTFGHQGGDDVLRSVCLVISQTVRTADIAVRYGGEKFLIIVPNPNFDGALCLAERLRSNFDALHIRVGSAANVRTSASFGVSSLVANGDDLDTLIKRADDARYRAKQMGRNRVCEQIVDVRRAGAV